jgi:pectin methylesterase-like acyl-CoA thioesterase
MYLKQFLGISVFALVISALVGVGQARAATLTVDDDHVQCPSAAFVTIQAAVIAASPGDRINVCPGIYHEQVVVEKPLTISGVDIAGQNWRPLCR